MGTATATPTTPTSPLRTEHAGNPTRSTPRIAALDGLRGLALVGMLAWHAKLDWVRGGFARMTIFFVLSGYLATISYLRLRDRDEPRPTLRYLQRRVRRLFPMTLVGVGAAVAVTATIGSVAARRSLHGDVLSVLGAFSNWRFIAEERPYGAMFESPSALQHFWSLSAEEQCIWLLPAVLAIALVFTRRRWLTVGLCAAGLLSIPVWINQSPDAIYYGTLNRAGEFLAGATLALWLTHDRVEPARQRGRLVNIVGIASLGILVVVMITIDRDTTWLYHGGLALMALPVVGVIAAVATGEGWTSHLLSLRPLTSLGRWALSIYVLHWPIYLVLDRSRTGLDGVSLALVQIAAAIAVGYLAHLLIERPLLPRTAGPQPGSQPSRAKSIATRDAVLLPGLGVCALALVALSTLVPVPAPVYDFEAAQARANQQPTSTTTTTGLPTETGSSPIEAPIQPVRALNVGVFGGSTGVLLGAALFDWANDIPDVQAVPAWSHYGCGFVTNGEYVGRAPDGSLEKNRPDPACAGWERNWLDSAQQNGVQVAVVITGVWETTDWVFDGRDAPSAIADPDFDDIIRAQISQALDELNSVGTHVIITTAPNIGPGVTGSARADRGLPEDHPRRVATYNQILRELANQRDGVTVIDYGAYIDSFLADQSVDWLPDGIHPTDAAARRIWQDFLGPQVREAVTLTWPGLL